MKLSELVSYLDDNGLALSNLPAITEQSIAGAISTGEWLLCISLHKTNSCRGSLHTSQIKPFATVSFTLAMD